MKIHCEPGHECRTFSTANWVDENNNHLFHERTYWGYSIDRTLRREKTPAEIFHIAFKAISNPLNIHYWMDVIYTQISDAKTDATRYGGVEQEFPYCEENNPRWFICFNDFDKALLYLREKTNIDYVAE